jgi:outer membrane protein
MTFKVRNDRRRVRAALAIVLVSSTAAALAEEPSQKAKSPWQVTLGVGGVYAPEYPGSDEYEARALPLISVRYKRVFLGGAPGSGSPGGLGAYLYEGDSWTLGAILSPDTTSPREESDDVRLRGLGDIDPATRAGLFSSYRIGWLTLSANAMTDVSDKQQGTIANFDAEIAYRVTAKLRLSAGPGVTWADEEFMQTFFGVTNAQALRSAFLPYTPEAGASVIRFSAGAQYFFASRWFLGVRATAAQLQGDAADSPIVLDENQNVYALFCGYRF